MTICNFWHILDLNQLIVISITLLSLGLHLLFLFSLLTTDILRVDIDYEKLKRNFIEALDDVFFPK